MICLFSSSNYPPPLRISSRRGWRSSSRNKTHKASEYHSCTAHFFFCELGWKSTRAKHIWTGELQRSGELSGRLVTYEQQNWVQSDGFFLLLRILPWVGWSGVDEMERIDCYNTSSIDNFPSRMDRAMGDWIGWQQDTSLAWWWMIPDIFPFPTSRRDRMGWVKQHKIYLLMGSWWGCAVAAVVVMHACLE